MSITQIVRLARPNIPDEAIDLLLQCLRISPEKRISAEGCVEAPVHLQIFFYNMNKNKKLTKKSGTINIIKTRTTTSIPSLEPLQTSQQSPHVRLDEPRDAKIKQQHDTLNAPAIPRIGKTIIKHQRFTLLPTLDLRNAQSNI